jgi:hypothetical protein
MNGWFKMRRLTAIIVFLSVLFFPVYEAHARAVRVVASETGESWFPVAIHMSTTVSDGNLSLSEILDVAKANGISVVIPTDRDFMRWEYGLWPFRNILKITNETNSVFKFGIHNYLKLIEFESIKNPDMVIIPGIESAPFYHWDGIPYLGKTRPLMEWGRSTPLGKFRIRDWHKHILVIGLDKAGDYKNLPVLPNKAALRKPFNLASALLLWPLFALFIGLRLFFRREFNYKDDLGHELGRFSKKNRKLGAVLAAASVLLLINNQPFCFFLYDQYAEQPSARPYQVLIDYVNQKNGLTFWAHPEAKNIANQGGIGIETSEHVEDLWKTKDYTGYAVFYEGYEKVGKINGEWDYLLSDYCEGRRKKPVWAIAGLAFDHGTAEDLTKLMQDAQTYVLASARTKEGILKSLGRGRMYCSRGIDKNRIFLKDFTVTDSDSQERVVVGGEIKVKGAPIIEIKGVSFGEGTVGREVEIRLDRDGKVIQVFHVSAPFEVRYEDKDFVKGKSFYRVEIKNGSQLIVTNPIFVEKE